MALMLSQMIVACMRSAMEREVGSLDYADCETFD